MDASWYYPDHFRWFYISDSDYVAMCSTCDANSLITRVGRAPSGWKTLDSPYRFICPNCKDKYKDKGL